MNEEFTVAIAQANDIRAGEAAAQKAISDAIIGTLITAFPPLADQLLQHLGALSEMQRQTLTEDGDLTNRSFERRISDCENLISALQDR